MNSIKFKNWLKKYGGLPLILGMLIVAFIFSRREQKSMLNNGRYTIAVTTGATMGYRGSPMVSYEYYVGGKKYRGTEYRYRYYIGQTAFTGHEDRYIIKGGYYYVKFDSTFPDRSKLLITMQVPDSDKNKNIPKFGWNDVPYMRYSIGYFDNKVAISFRYKDGLYNFNPGIDTIQKRDFGKYCLVSFSILDPWVDAKYYPGNVSDSIAYSHMNQGWKTKPAIY